MSGADGTIDSRCFCVVGGVKSNEWCLVSVFGWTRGDFSACRFKRGRSSPLFERTLSGSKHVGQCVSPTLLVQRRGGLALSRPLALLQSAIDVIEHR